MSWLRSITAGTRLSGLALALALGFCCEPAAGTPNDSCELQLEVFINQAPTHLIGAFTMVVGQRIAARRAELEEIGLRPRGDASPDEMIMLDELAGLTYRYEQASQQIFITAADELRARKRLNASAPAQDEVAVRTDYGGVLNYNLFAATSRPSGVHSFALTGSSATLDARAFAPFGTLSQSGILRSSFDNRFDALRLDTTFAYSDRETLTTYRAGDTINGGLAWTRPIRIGGVQMQRNFTLRPDLVLLPLPSAAGSAAVPSTIDVFVNSVKVSSQQIDSGPYQVNNVPATTGSGTARVVLRDASGRETVTNLPFYVSSKLLAEGLFDYSVEAGMPRLSYGTSADTYAKSFVASASGRRGVADWTLEGHAEAGAGLLNAGGGVEMRTGSLGVASAALSGSRYIGQLGLQSYLAYETSAFGISMQVSSQRTFGSYDDLASATARLQASLLADTQSVLASLSSANSAVLTPSPLWTSARPPKALEHISLGLPLPFDLSTLSASFIHLNDASGRISNILSASWSRAFAYNATAFVTAFKDISDRRNCGFMVGLSMPLGEALASAGVTRDSNGTHPTLDVVKPLGQQPGSIGWRVHDAEGNAPDRSAAVSYRSTFARVEATAEQNGSNANATAQIDGAVVTMGNGVFFTNRIDDAFAVVDAGVAGVEVFHENRSVGFTDANGRALIPSLRSYQKNKISIDTRNLPVDADLTGTQAIVAPADRSGVRVNFGVRTDTRAAILVLATPDGQPLAAGSQGRVEQTEGEEGETFVVGYDGRACVKGLASRNTVAVALADRECRATFDYSSQPNEQVVIPVTCR